MTQKENPTEFISEWWGRIRNGEKLVQTCHQCGHDQLHPRRRCNSCSASDLGFKAVTGDATVYTFTTIYHNAPSEFVSDMPYTLAVVRLSEGPQMLTRLVNCDPAEIRCDMPVQWTLTERAGKLLPCFEPANKAGNA